MTKKELVKFLVDNFTDKDGYLDLSGLDFSDYKLYSINISKIKANCDLRQREHEIKGNLSQNSHNVKGNIFQNRHKVDGDLIQGEHKVKGSLFQNRHNVDGHLLEGYSYYSEEYTYMKPIEKQLKEITEEELRRMGYKLK